MSRIKIDKSKSNSEIAEDFREQATKAVEGFRKARKNNEEWLDQVHADIVENLHVRRLAAYLQYGVNSLVIERSYLREAHQCSMLALKYEQKALRERSK